MVGDELRFDNVCEAVVTDCDGYASTIERVKVVDAKSDRAESCMPRQATIPFRTTPDQILKLPAIVLEMEKAGVDRNFLVEADALARRDQGVFDLMELWAGAANDQAERDEVISDIQRSISDTASPLSGA